MRILRVTFFWITLLAASEGFAQKRLYNVRATSTGTGVLVEFYISAGQTCNGYSIWHSADSLAPFMQVLDNGGAVCGDMMKDEYFAVVHTSPVQERTNYYRVHIDFPFEQSSVYSTYVSAQGRSAITAYPNPLPADEAVLKAKLSLPVNARLTGTLHNRFGVRKQEIDVDAVEGLISIPIRSKEHGVYLLWLTDGTNVYSTKVVFSP